MVTVHLYPGRLRLVEVFCSRRTGWVATCTVVTPGRPWYGSGRSHTTRGNEHMLNYSHCPFSGSFTKHPLLHESSKNPAPWGFTRYRTTPLTPVLSGSLDI